MLKIRLTRFGKKKRAFYRIVVMDSRKKRDGSSLDLIGIYDPIENKLEFDTEIYSSYIKKGAQPTETVAILYRKFSTLSVQK